MNPVAKPRAILLRVVGVWARHVGLGGIGLGLGLVFTASLPAGTPLPAVEVARIHAAERLEVPAPAGGTVGHEGFYLFAGEWLAESRPLAPASGLGMAPFEITVRRAADRVAVYTLPADAWGSRLADGALFSDGALLAVRVRSRPGGVARLAIHDLATGAARFELTLPIWASGLTESDDFGRAVWFTEDRILVAAPGRDRLQTDDGVVFVFERATGRYVASLSPGIKNARFGAPPAAGGRDPQPAGVPYVQVDGNRALIVHGRRAFLFAGDRLRTLIIPPTGLHASRLRGAVFSENRIILATSEILKGRPVPGRLLAYEPNAGRLRYQIRGSAFGASYQFATRMVAADGRLWVHDSEAGNGQVTRGALHCFDLGTGRRVRGVEFPSAEGSYQDGASLERTGGRLWLRFLQASPPSSSYADPSSAVWRAFDPESLVEIARLAPPYPDTFVGRAPQPLADGRWAVAALNRVNYFTFISEPTLSAARRTRSWVYTGSSVVVIDVDPWTLRRTALLYDDKTEAWTHRLILAGNLASGVYDQASAYDRLRFADGAAPGEFVVAPDAALVREFQDYATVLPLLAPEVTFEARLDFTPRSGFAYDLLRRAPEAADFTPLRSLGTGDDMPRAEIVPYADFLAAVEYRLDGIQFSRRPAEPAVVGLPVRTSSAVSTALAGDRVARAFRAGASSSSLGRIEVFDVAADVDVYTVTLPYGFSIGQLLLDDTYVVCGEAGYDYSGEIRFYDAATGAPAFTIKGGKGFGNRFALSAGRLVASAVITSYEPGVYTHWAVLTVHELPSKRLLRTIPLGKVIESSVSLYPSTDFAVSGDLAVVRNFDDGSAFATAGRVRVLDLESGETRYVLDAPEPAQDDNYGAWLAAAGDWLAIGAPGRGEVHVHDLATGAFRHTLTLLDRPGGAQNVDTSVPRLTIDPDSGLLAWLADDPPASTGGPSLGPTRSIYLFDLNTGLEEARLSAPAERALTFDSGRLHLASTVERFTHDFAATIAEPLTDTLLPLLPQPRAALAFSTRLGVTYQPEASADEGATWSPLGAALRGNGGSARLVRPLDAFADPDALRFRVVPRWSETN